MSFLKKKTVWAALGTEGLIGPYFFQKKDDEGNVKKDDEGNVKTINSEHYSNLLKRKFLLALRRKGIGMTQVWFQQDGAAPNTAQVVLQWLGRTFDTRLIPWKSDRPWPTHFPDLSPLDFFLWFHLKERVYKVNPTSIEGLKLSISQEMRNIAREMCYSAVTNFVKRVVLLRRRNGRHFKYML